MRADKFLDGRVARQGCRTVICQVRLVLSQAPVEPRWAKRAQGTEETRRGKQRQLRDLILIDLLLEPGRRLTGETFQVLLNLVSLRRVSIAVFTRPGTGSAVLVTVHRQQQW